MSESRKEWKKIPLLQRLRSYEYLALDHICCEAAERIEELEAERVKAKALLDAIQGLRTARRGTDTKVAWMAINGAESALVEVI
jgi:hypothetical protein